MSARKAGPLGAHAAPGARSMGQLLGALLKKSAAGREVSRERLDARWRAAIGEELAARAVVVGLTKGVLEIEVDSAALLQELSTFYRAELVAALRKSGAAGEVEISDLKLRLARGTSG